MSVLDNPTCFSNPFQFEITFECLQELDDDLEWKVLYVGSAYDSHQDQVLDEILVGPVPVGLNKFVLQADPPRVDKLPAEEILGVTVVLVTCSYREREFVRIGYYVNNEYIPEEPTEDPDEAQKSFDPSRHLGRVQRQILADKPRVTKFSIPWGDATVENTEPMIDQSQSLLKDLPMQEGTPSTAATMEMDE
ncbi:histone chaperone ASF1 [Fistulifera solaris]|uniref:Histone chaperone ASF1 n=1 Tax=Fistulifera solaris TaxID=1519565 RepID=A0A1Z5JQ19_FISSO|nr:histone chaperone ASF1 [Fistulifera solaris]|eukprot:GAX16059.1 histone chaperone ASF1 [Fistulifera solaris]